MAEDTRNDMSELTFHGVALRMDRGSLSAFEKQLRTSPLPPPIPLMRARRVWQTAEAGGLGGACAGVEGGLR